MKFPLEVVDGQHYGYGSDFIVDADNHIIADPIPHDAAEIVRRCNAYDELLDFILEIDDGIGTAKEVYDRARVLATKYDASSSED